MMATVTVAVILVVEALFILWLADWRVVRALAVVVGAATPMLVIMGIAKMVKR